MRSEGDTEAKGVLGLPELVIFDVDGTLQDSQVWWPRIAKLGVRAFSKTIGRALPEPDHQLAYSVLGKADSGVWASLLPDSMKEQWRDLRSVVVPLEVEELRRGVDYCFPGTRELLLALRARSVRIALASNCRAAYFESMLEGQGLGALVDDAFCLDSEGVRDKADMVALALRAAGTRDAVMVGDRSSDQEAAATHGLPFLLRTGFLRPGELRADAWADSQEEVLDRLKTRERFFEELAARAPERSIGVTGPVGVGKSVFGRALARVLGRPFLDLDSFLRADQGAAEVRAPGPCVGSHLDRAADLEAFSEALDAADPGCVVSGIFLEDPRLRGRFQRVFHLVASRETLRQRVLGRDGEAAVRGLEESWLPAWRDFEAHRSEDPGRTWISLDSALRPACLEPESFAAWAREHGLFG